MLQEQALETKNQALELKNQACELKNQACEIKCLKTDIQDLQVVPSVLQVCETIKLLEKNLIGEYLPFGDLLVHEKQKTCNSNHDY